MSVNNANMSELITRMKVIADRAQGSNNTPLNNENVSSFGNVLKDQLGEINTAMQDSKELKEKYAMGDKNVSLLDVKLASEKSNVYFNFTVESVNRVIAAYKEVMSYSV